MKYYDEQRLRKELGDRPRPEDGLTDKPRDLMKVEEVADYFQVSEFTLKKWMRDGVFDGVDEDGKRQGPFKVGGAWRIHRVLVVEAARRMAAGELNPEPVQYRRKK